MGKRTVSFTAFLVFAAILGPHPCRAENEEKKEKKDFKIQGRLGLGLEQEPDDSVGDIFETRLGVKTHRKKGVRAYVEVKSNEGSKDIKINDAFVDYRTKDRSSQIRAGRGKKVLGWEYEYPTADRLTIHRSAAYRYLADRAVVGRDYFASYEWHLRRDESEDEDSDEAPNAESYGSDASMGSPRSMIDPSEKLKAGVSLHYDEQKDYAIVLNAVATFGSNWRIGAWVSTDWNRDQNHVMDFFEGALSGLFQAGPHRAALEFFSGDDPFRTQIEKVYGSKRNVPYASLKFEYGLYFDGFNPYVVPTVLWRDLDHGSDRNQVLALGLRYYVSTPLSFAIEWDRRKSVTDFDPTSVPYEHSEVLFVGRYFF